MFPIRGRSLRAIARAGATCAAALAPGSPAGAQWEDAEIVVLAGTELDERSTPHGLAVDSEGRPHAIWSAGSLVFYSREEGGEWIPPIEIGFDDAVYTGYAIAIVPGTTTPAVLYSRRPMGDPTGDLWLAVGSGLDFTSVQLTDDELGEFGPALAMDPSGAYHAICVSEIESVWRLRYLTDVTGQAIEHVVTAGPLGDFGSGASPAIAADDDGRVHVTYRGMGFGYRVHHAENDAPGSNVWTWQALLSGNAEDFSSDVAIDAGGGVHVAVSGNDCFGCNPRTFYFYRPPDGGWQPYVGMPHAPGLAEPSLALDAGSSPHIATAEVSGNIYTGNLFYASAANGWDPVLIVGTDHGQPSLAVDGAGFGHFVCTTGPNTGVEDVIYLRSTHPIVGVMDPGPVLGGTRWSAAPNPFASSVVLSRRGAPAGGTIGPIDVQILDVSGRIVRTLTGRARAPGSAGAVWDGRDDRGIPVPPGVYYAAEGRASSLALVKLW